MIQPQRRGATLAFLLLLLAFLTGCASPHAFTTAPRPFDFAKDSFAFENELVWEYGYNEGGEWTSTRRKPKPEYFHRCFVMARAAQQFFQGAVFDTNQPVESDATYRRLVRQVLKTNLRKPVPDENKIVIPGYPSLRVFSKAHEHVLKDECGGPWASYFQRGHWRMVFPFSRRHQAGQAERLLAETEQKRTAIVHLVRFPRLSINHAMVVYSAEPAAEEILFRVYDPNQPEAPAELRFDRRKRTFTLPASDYFKGGRVDVYQVYHHWAY